MGGDGLPPRAPSAPERALTGVAVVALFALAGLVTVNVISRWLDRALIPDDIMLVREAMVLVVLLPLGLVTARREHIAVDVFTAWAGPRAQRVLAVLGHAVGLAFAAALLWAAWSGLARAWRTGEYYYGTLNLPQWIGYATFTAAVALFAARAAWMLAADLRDLRG